MASWRSIRGHIERLDPFLTSHEQILEFFANERILGRGERVGDGFDFEIAVGGRRRRVATLDDAGVVIHGKSIGDLVVAMQDELRKVAVDVGGKVVHGPIDLGSVDVDVDDYDVNPELLDELVRSREAGDDDDVAGDSMPDLDDGPMLVISDLAMSEVPAVATAENEPIAVSKLGEARVLVAENSFSAYRRVFPRPNYVIVLSTDRMKKNNPTLVVRRDNVRATWNFSGEFPVFDWIHEGTAGYDFVLEELGASAIARLAVADIIDARFADVRRALLASPADATAALVHSLGLPDQVGDVLDGSATLSDVPASRIFTPKRVAGAFEDSLAWEIAGEGVVEPKVMKAVRELYIERPWMVALGSTAQAAVAGAVLGVSASRARRGLGSKMLTAVGVGVLISAFTRIGTTTYMQDVVSRYQSDINTWREG